ncbi:MAG: guanylate kinase [Desulfuromonas sp.]|nr:MAG: guanylate kinase [Desulfuromonas sp.]
MSSNVSAAREGVLFVVSAPSGAGKTSLCKQIVDIFPTLGHSISFTTRPQRSGEQDGVDYHFVSPEQFAAMVEDNEFAEWAEVHGNCYGTARKTIDAARDAGEDLLLEIDWQGAAQLRGNGVDGVFVFILPPSFEELRKRLEGRGTDAPEVIEQRLQNARRELQEAFRYDYQVVNDDFAQALQELKSIVAAEHCRAVRLRGQFEKLFPAIVAEDTL